MLAHMSVVYHVHVIFPEWQVTCVFPVATSHSQAKWRSAQDEDPSETAVFIEPPEGAVTRVSLRLMCRTASFVTIIAVIMKTDETSPPQTRRGGPGLMRTLRAAFCSRQRTPLLFSLYLLTVHVLLLMCLAGYLWKNQLPSATLTETERGTGKTTRWHRPEPSVCSVS